MLNATKRAQANIVKYKDHYKVVKKTSKLVRKKGQVNIMARVLRAVLCKKLMASLKNGAVKTKYLH
jgi:tRNA1(Val) A37 N6-methylase TrmN6